MIFLRSISSLKMHARKTGENLDLEWIIRSHQQVSCNYSNKRITARVRLPGVSSVQPTRHTGPNLWSLRHGNTLSHRLRSGWHPQISRIFLTSFLSLGPSHAGARPSRPGPSRLPAVSFRVCIQQCRTCRAKMTGGQRRLQMSHRVKKKAVIVELAVGFNDAANEVKTDN